MDPVDFSGFECKDVSATMEAIWILSLCIIEMHNKYSLFTKYPLTKGPPCRNSPPSDKNRKVHKMCARYREIPDVKFRRGLGFEPIVNWFVPAPVLLAMMLPGWVWGFLVSTFVEGTGWLIRCNRVRPGAKKPMSSSSRENAVDK